ncbi:helix-turn-helix domain-containing protein [Enterobacter cancerogenus]|uniref:helix-turn-helix domain-containing protein n=1 Tax=Enterobacter cancerogenus TaxID=69218 RepID=UPI0023628807|nr:helix-turn-helix transcriptional regulator [Enterobacter cancerogenus]
MFKRNEILSGKSPKGKCILITSDIFLMNFFENEILNKLHDSIDVYSSLNNKFINLNATYYIDSRTFHEPDSYAKFLEISVFYDNKVCLMNFNNKSFHFKSVDMKKSANVIIKLFESGDAYINGSLPQNSLTKQEVRVLKYITSGVSANLLAKELNLSVKTIHSHKNSAIRKLGFRNFHAFISSNCDNEVYIAGLS